MNKIHSFLLSILIVVIFAACTNTTQKDKSHAVDKENSEVNMNSAADIMAKAQVPVLCYHRITTGRNDEYTVTPAAFSAQMQLLKDSG